MRWVAIGSIVLAAMLVLVPWQICDCAADGPRLELLWGHAECPAPSSSDPEHPGGEPDCDTLFTFDARSAEGAPTLLLPDDAHDVESVIARIVGVQPVWIPVRLRIQAEPPDPGAASPHATLVDRLLI